jgi:AcrR family transcriptional regulator
MIKMSLRERKKEEKLERIEQAGRELFAKQGFHQTTTRQLAEHAGIGAGTLFVYFPQKLDLLLHLFRKDISREVEQAFDGVDDDGPLLDALMHVFGSLVAYYARDKRLSQVFIKELNFLPGGPRDEMTELVMGMAMRLATLVAHAKRRGELPPQVMEVEAATYIFGAYSFAVLGWMGGSVGRDQALWMLRRNLELLLTGMRAQR